MTIIIWDKIFGTFQKEEHEEPIEFGVRKDTPLHPVLLMWLLMK